MPDPISSAGAQGQSPPAAALAAVQASVAPAANKGAATTVASATSNAIQAAAQESQAAAKLELSSSVAPSSGKDQPVNSVMTMEEAAQAFQDYLQSLPSNLQFKPDYEAGIVVFKVINPVTQKVIRQLPPEEVVNQVRAMRLADKRGHSGILLDESL